MQIRHLFTAMCITIGLSFSLSSHAASVNTVYSVSSAVVVGETIQASTITRGFAANQPLYRAMIQTVPKSLFLTTFRKVIGITPYGIAALAAYEAYGYFFDEETGDLVKHVAVPGSGWANYIYGGAWYDITIDEARQLVSNARGIDLQYIFAFPYSNYYQICESRNLGVSCHQNFANFFPDGIVVENQSITDSEFWQAQIDYMNDNLNVNHNDAFLNADGTVNQDYFPDPNFEVYTAADAELIELYGNGLLQSTDPQAQNYVTPEEYARIKELYDQANQTDEQKAEALNDEMLQPITNEQYKAEQLEIEKREQSRLVSAATGLSGLNVNADEYSGNADDITQDFIDALTTTNDLPTDANGFLSYYNFTSQSGCKTVDLPFGVVFPTVSQCEKLGTLKDLLAYFLFILISWNIINTVLREAN